MRLHRPRHNQAQPDQSALVGFVGYSCVENIYLCWPGL